MIHCLLLVKGEDVDEEALDSLSLMNAKHLIIGDAHGFGIILHLAANSLEDINNAASDILQVPEVGEIVTLVLRK